MGKQIDIYSFALQLCALPLMNSFNKTEAAVFSFRPCFLRAILSSVFYNIFLRFKNVQSIALLKELVING